MTNYVFRIFLALSSCVLIQFGLRSSVSAQIERHMVVYGGLRDADIVKIAENIDTLVVGKISRSQLKQLKKVNPDLTILKYVNCLGVYNSYPEWKIVNQHEDWFAHDRITDRRLIQKNRGWFLMNIANVDWRQFTAERIAKQTDRLFDGIFIDNFWNRFIRKFVAEGTTQSALPGEDFIIKWTQNMTALLTQIRAVFPKLIFINGAHEQYIAYVDGCMEESFIHSSWNPDIKHHDPSRYLRSLKHIQELAKHGKLILAQSGTRGDDTSKTNDIYRLCFTSYLLVWDKNISFNFHPFKTYSFKGLYQIDDYRLNLGRPLGNYYIYKQDRPASNLLLSGNLNNGLMGWGVISGNPSPDPKNSISGKSVRFKGSASRSDKIASGFIPVKGGTDYIISAEIKSEKNISVSQRYKRFGLQALFYDKNHKQIPGRYNLPINAGTYGWQPFETTLTSPQNAGYFQIKMGFGTGGFGEVWIDNIYVGVAIKREIILKRDFSNGSVFVNYGNKNTTVELKKDKGRYGSKYLVIKPREGKILRHDKSLD